MKKTESSPENRVKKSLLSERVLTAIIMPARRIAAVFFLSLIVSFPVQLNAQKKQASAIKDTIRSGDFSGLKFRSIGPAFCSGRIADFAVNPKNNAE